MQFEGHGYEFAAKYYGGPGDGLESSLISLESEIPPKVSCLELYNLIESKTPLGQHFLQHRPPSQTRVGVYMLENEPKEYDCDADTLVYRFVEMMNYGDYVKKYGEK